MDTVYIWNTCTCVYYCEPNCHSWNILFSAKCSRCNIFADWCFQNFRGNNFCGPIRIPFASIRYSTKISRSLIFEDWCQSAKNAKIMRLENLGLYGIWKFEIQCIFEIHYLGPLLEVELESACLSGRVRRPLYSFDSTQPLGCLGSSVVRASV